MSLTVMGFDYGRNKTGVAVGQTTTGTSQALETITANGDALFERIAKLINEWKPDALVVGMPYAADGSDTTPICKAARRFGDRLAKVNSLPVHYVDERLTSSAANHVIRESMVDGKKLTDKKKKLRDAIAAELILQSWLSSN